MISKAEIKRLNALKIKKYRQINGQFVVEGPKILHEFLAAQIIPKNLYCTEKMAATFEGLKSLQPEIVSEEDLRKISSLQEPQGCLAVFKMPEPPSLPDGSSWVLAADHLQDPGNLGTLIRIADWFGIKDFVCSPDTADVYNPKVVQASMGSLSRVHVHYTALEAWLPGLSGTPVYAGTLDGENITKVRFEDRGVLLIGNEGKGIRAYLEPFITKTVTIPRLGGAESLNAGVAAGIMVALALLSR